jgi:hypothetical protein
MVSSEEVWQEVFAGLERLRGRWPSPDWIYDRRLKCVASSVPLNNQAILTEARAAIAEVLPTSWSAATLGEAPEEVRALADRCGGLRSSQLLFWAGAQDGPGSPGPFGLWWPWGDGTTVSLRVGLHDVDAPKERYPRLRDIFGIPQAPGPA